MKGETAVKMATMRKMAGWTGFRPPSSLLRRPSGRWSRGEQGENKQTAQTAHFGKDHSHAGIHAFTHSIHSYLLPSPPLSTLPLYIYIIYLFMHNLYMSFSLLFSFYALLSLSISLSRNRDNRDLWRDLWWLLLTWQTVMTWRTGMTDGPDWARTPLKPCIVALYVLYMSLVNPLQLLMMLVVDDDVWWWWWWCWLCVLII